MATNKTTNYQLNQWAKTDRILMDDFNADNQKLDAAIASRLGPAEIIKTIAIPQRTAYVDVDLSDMDWDQWDMVVLHYDQFNNDAGEIYARVYTKGGDLAPATGNGSGSSLYSGKSFPLFIFFFPLRDKSRRVISLSVAETASTGMASIPFSDIQYLQLGFINSMLMANSSVTVWGIR